MDDIQLSWVGSDGILKIDKNLEIKQVYTWIIKNGEIVIVSKDGLNWQLPGGKPNKNEKVYDTAVREIREETGLILNNEKFYFLGYYKLKDLTNINDKEIIQIRLYCQPKRNLTQNDLNISYEDNGQLDSEKIKYAKLVSLNHSKNLIPWLDSSGEYHQLKKNNII